MNNKWIILFVAISLLQPYDIMAKAKGKSYNPLDFGLADAANGVERFWILYRTHELAKKTNAPVTYKGVESLEIEIPVNAPSIPLSSNTDFCGLVLSVVCNYNNSILFELTQDVTPIEVSKEDVDDGYYGDNPILSKGTFLLQLSDENLWVKQRAGFDYGHQRMDIVYVKNGKAKNTTVFPYNNNETILSARYCEVSPERKFFGNLIFRRKEGNSHVASLIVIDHQYNVEIENIEIKTPVDTLYADQAIIATNSCKIDFKNIRIDGTYSRPDAYGYGITMNNVYNVTFNRLYGHGNWGVFGNNNLNKIYLQDCDINRFDVHCYGKDITCSHCAFHDLYNQFSSMNGSVVFKDCEFYNFIPFQYETSFNAYTKFSLVFKQCSVYATNDKNYLIDVRGLSGIETGERTELREQKYPDLVVNGLTVYLENGNGPYYIYNQGNNFINKSTKVPDVIGVKRVKVMTDGKVGSFRLGTIENIVSQLRTGVFVVGGGLACCVITYKATRRKKQSGNNA